LQDAHVIGHFGLYGNTFEPATEKIDSVVRNVHSTLGVAEMGGEYLEEGEPMMNLVSIRIYQRVKFKSKPIHQYKLPLPLHQSN
jgi:hypothetical protein